MSSITGEYWIIDGRAEFADGDTGDKNHETFAYEHLAADHIQQIYNLAKSLKMSVPSYQSLEYEDSLNSTHDLLSSIKDELIKDGSDEASVFETIRKGLSIEKEALQILMQGVFFGAPIDPRVYMMKKEGWIVVRNNNIELYGYNDQKRSGLLNGLEEILDQEGIESSDEEIELYFYDHKTGRSWDSTLEGLKSPTGARTVTLPNTTYNKPIFVPTDTSKKILGSSSPRYINAQTRSKLSTSESMNFKSWLLKEKNGF